MTYLLQPLDLTTNASLKKIEKRAFSKYFSTGRRSGSRCHNNKSRLTTFRLEASICQCSERGVSILRIFKSQRGDIE